LIATKFDVHLNALGSLVSSKTIGFPCLTGWNSFSFENEDFTGTHRLAVIDQHSSPVWPFRFTVPAAGGGNRVNCVSGKDGLKTLGDRNTAFLDHDVANINVIEPRAITHPCIAI
jgi:hypothetical protein